MSNKVQTRSFDLDIHASNLESRTGAAVWFTVITGIFPETSIRKGSFPPWLSYFWGLEQISPLHPCTLITSTPFWRLQPTMFLLHFQLIHGVVPECYFICCVILWFSSFTFTAVRYRLQQDSCMSGCEASVDIYFKNAQYKIPWTVLTSTNITETPWTLHES